MSRVASSSCSMRAIAPPNIVPAGILDGMDHASSTLVLRLQLDDINQLLGSRTNELSGWEQTLLSQKEEIQRVLALNNDRQMSLSMTRAVMQDQNAIKALEDEERQAERDRAMACEIAGIPVPPRANVPSMAGPSAPPSSRAAASNAFQTRPTNSRQDPPRNSFQNAENSSGSFNSFGKRARQREEIDEPAERPSKRVASGRHTVIDLTESAPAQKFAPVEKQPSLPCVSCGDDYDPTSLAHMKFEHDYCQDCLQQVVLNALNDEACYPPRCCRQPFQMDDMRRFLTPEIISGFHEKAVEFGTANRIYCCNPTCSTFLHPVNINGDRGECPICLVATCTICKGPSHQGDCPQDTGVQQVLALANGEGWKRFSKCKAVVELGIGCNHITCRCKAEWCYVCGARWKTCGCIQWLEDRLLAGAERIVDRDQDRPARPRPQQVAAARQHLILHHECDHGQWDRVGGRADCDECGRNCNRYHFRCQRCRMDACHACYRNRV